MFNYLDLQQAEEYVTRENQKGHTVLWEGWEILSWRPNSRGFLRTDGAFVNGRWGVLRRIRPNKYGKYRVSVS